MKNDEILLSYVGLERNLGFKDTSHCRHLKALRTHFSTVNDIRPRSSSSSSRKQSINPSAVMYNVRTLRLQALHGRSISC